MRVLMITSSYPKYPGDVTAPMIEKIVFELAGRGHAVDLVLPRHPELQLGGRERGLAVRFFSFYAGSGKDYAWGYASSMRADRALRPRALAIAPIAFLAGLRTVRRLLASERYDVTHAHWVLPNGPIAALAAGPADPPLVVSLHGSDIFLAERSAILAVIARRTFRRAGWITACSGDLRNRAIRLGAPPERVATLPYGVDVGELNLGDAISWRRRAGAGDGDFLVVMLGRLVAKKGFSHLLRAAAALGARGVPIRVGIGGTGDLAAQLRAEAKDLSLEGRVRFLGDVPHGEVGALLRAADVVAVPSVRDERGNVDGLPNVLLEAMAAARPIVATRIAGIPDVVEDGENGLLAPPEADGALADALARLHADPTLGARLGAAALERARALSWGEYGNRLLGGYERAIRGAGPG